MLHWQTFLNKAPLSNHRSHLDLASQPVRHSQTALTIVGDPKLQQCPINEFYLV